MLTSCGSVALNYFTTILLSSPAAAEIVLDGLISKLLTSLTISSRYKINVTINSANIHLNESLFSAKAILNNRYLHTIFVCARFIPTMNPMNTGNAIWLHVFPLYVAVNPISLSKLTNARAGLHGEAVLRIACP